MDWLTGMLTGYAKRSRDIEDDKLLAARDAAAREAEIFKLMLAHRDPKIRAMAGTGLIAASQPQKRRKGIAGWMGEMESNPVYPQLLKYLDTEQLQGYEDTPVAGLPSRQSQGASPIPMPGETTRDETGLGALPRTDPAAPFTIPRQGMILGQPPPQMSAALPSTAATQGGPITARTPPPSPPPGPPPTTDPAAAYRQSLDAQTARIGQRPTPGEPPASIVAPPAPPPAPPPEPPPMLRALPTPPWTQADWQGPKEPPPISDLTTTTQQPGPAIGRVDTREIWGKPEAFPTPADLKVQAEQASVEGEIAGWQEVYKRAGYPDWQQKGIDAVLAQRMRAAGSQRLSEGNYRQVFGPEAAAKGMPEGSWVQDLYHPTTGQLMNTIPYQGPGAGGVIDSREALAFRRYGKQGELPNQTLLRLSPRQMGVILEDERIEKGLNAAEIAYRKAQVEANAPLSTQAQFQATELLSTKWDKYQEPLRMMQRQFSEMLTGIKRFKEGDKVGGSEAVRVTFEKILDPDSVVREGEYARQTTGLSLWERFEGFWQRYGTGGGEIPLEVLEGIVETARQFITGLEGFNSVQQGRLGAQASRFGLDPRLVFGMAPGQPPPAPPPPQGPPSGGGPGGGGPINPPGGIGLDTPMQVDPTTGRIIR